MPNEANSARYALKTAIRHAVELLGGCNAASMLVRVDAPRLSRYGNVQAPENAPSDVCYVLDAELIKAGHSPVILRTMADTLGYSVVSNGEAEAQKLAHDVTSLAGEFAAEAGEAVQTILTAAADGSISGNDSRQIHDALRDVDTVVVRLSAITRKHVVG